MRKLFAVALLHLAAAGCQPSSPPVREAVAVPKPHGTVPPRAPAIDFSRLRFQVPPPQGDEASTPPPPIRRLPSDKPI